MNTLIGRSVACAALALAAALPGPSAGAHAGAVAAPSSPLEVPEQVSSARPEAPPVVGIRYRSRRERRFVRHVVRWTTGITPLEARFIWRHRPRLARRLPYSVSDSAYASGSSPAAFPPAAPDRTETRWTCTVTTTRRVKTFIGITLFSMKMRQSWEYDGTRVYNPGPVQLWPDVTNWGLLWHFGGIVLAEDYYWDDSFSTHTSKRISLFASPDIAGGAGSNVLTQIHKNGNGDWATQNVVGRPWCQDDD